MPLSTNDQKRIHDFYESSLKEYGPTDARSLHWIDMRSQHIRFEILSHLSNLSGKKILDVGCGFGDFYEFLQNKNIVCDYTGIDIIPEFIEQAQKRFSISSGSETVQPTFRVQDIFDITEKDTCDIVIASGALSFKMKDTDNTAYYLNMIKKMFEISKHALGFNMLNNAIHIDDETFAAYDPNIISDYCKTLCEHVEIMTDYLPQDFSIFMYKNKNKK